MLFKSLRTWILAICMSILLVITPLLYFSFNLNFYKEHLPQSTNEQQTLVQNIQQFLFYKETSNLDITSEEYSHMLDVQTIFQKVLLTEAIAFLLFLLIIFSFYGHRGNHAILLGIHRGARVFFGLSCIIALLVMIDFHSFFMVFHKIFFPQGNWYFAESSILIQLFPESFFQTIATHIFLTSTGISLGIILLSLVYKWYKKIFQ